MIRKGSLVIYAFAVWAMGVTLHGATINVPSNQPTIQAGIDAAVDGDTVMVASGTYTGSGNINVKFKGKEIIVRSYAGWQFTIIDCGEPGNRAFVFDQGETALSKLIGFTICNGDVRHRYDGGLPDKLGGAIKIKSSPAIQSCVISNCKAENGGGISIADPGSSVYLNECIFQFDSASSYDGGAIYYGNGASVTIRNCSFSNTYAIGSGGGIYLGIPGADIEYCYFCGCRCGDNGGAIFVGGAVTISNCTLTKNHAMFGSAILVASGVHMNCNRNLIALNHGSTGALRVNSGGSVSFSCNDFWSNDFGSITGTYDSTDVDGNTIFVNPLFCDAANDDYSISSYSPCDEDSSLCGQLIGRWDDACDYCCLLGGDANNDGNVNILDITFLINYLYKGGPEPPCLDAGDADGNCEINVLDITRIIMFVYHDQEPPVCGCVN
jgi:hypothetical protein